MHQSDAIYFDKQQRESKTAAETFYSFRIIDVKHQLPIITIDAFNDQLLVSFIHECDKNNRYDTMHDKFAWISKLLK